MDPRANPYLSHMYEGENENGYGSYNRQSTGKGKQRSLLETFKRHETTAPQAMEAEDGPDNAFTGKPLSNRYFGILKTRRNLPVHAQRYVSSAAFV
jgi:pre-mRNA-splicing factor ATP-dependent RNA helicase DHX15/PRP43